jgi:citrate synthase
MILGSPHLSKVTKLGQFRKLWEHFTFGGVACHSTIYNQNYNWKLEITYGFKSISKPMGTGVTSMKDDAEAILTVPSRDKEGETEEIRLPVKYDTYNNMFIDIRKLYAEHRICSFDPGFTSSASCASAITYIDGDAGILLYRGYDIEELVKHGDFYDCSYLLIHGELPNAVEKGLFKKDITEHTLLHEKCMDFLKGFHHDAHPMAILCGCIGSMAAFYPELEDVSNPEQQIRACHRLIAKIPTLAAMSYKVHLVGQPIVYPRNDLDFAENFLYMMHALPTAPYEVDKVQAKALETIILLHMDHEQNASTSTVRTAGSSQANPFTCISSGIASLHGPRHGGASTAVIKMLLEIQKLGGVDAIPEILERAKDKQNPFRLMGFGHRVYKTFDPRARIMKKMTAEVLEKMNTKDPLLDIAVELEKQALQDEYFVKRNLYPNIDFYSGIVMCALSIPLEMMEVIFALARTVGWVAQWREYVREPFNKISRPRQLYTGKTRREFVDIQDRSGIDDTLTKIQSSKEQRSIDRIFSSQRTRSTFRA